MGDTTKRNVVIDGVSIEMEQRDSQIVERAFRSMEDQLRDMAATIEAKDEEMESKSEEAAEEKKKNKEEMEKKDAIIVSKDAEIEELKAKLKDSEMTPDKLDALVDARSVIIERARAVMGDAKAEFKGKTLNDVRRAVVDSKLGDKSKGWSDAQVEAVFDSFQVSESKKETTNGLDSAVAAFSRPAAYAADADESRMKVYDDYDADISNAWQKQSAA